MVKRKVSQNQIKEVLKKVVDPELGENIVDLGLVYGLVVKDELVLVKMTLTSPACPLGGIITQEVEKKLKGSLGIKRVKVEFTFNPPWSPQKMAPHLRAKFGF